MQIVVCKNKVLAYGPDDSFINVDGVVVCNETGRSFQNSTVISTDTPIPSDIDKVSYEYEFGTFIAAPWTSNASEIIETNKKDAVKFWYGTTAEFNAITTKDELTQYVLTDDDTATQLDEIEANINDILDGTTSVPKATHTTEAERAVNKGTITDDTETDTGKSFEFDNTNGFGTHGDTGYFKVWDLGHPDGDYYCALIPSRNGKQKLGASDGKFYEIWSNSFKGGPADNAKNVTESIAGNLLTQIFQTEESPDEPTVILPVVNEAYQASHATQLDTTPMGVSDEITQLGLYVVTVRLGQLDGGYTIMISIEDLGVSVDSAKCSSTDDIYVHYNSSLQKFAAWDNNGPSSTYNISGVRLITAY